MSRGGKKMAAFTVVVIFGCVLVGREEKSPIMFKKSKALS